MIRIFKGGVKFDISAILMINSLYIFLISLPFSFRNNRKYQNFLKILFLATNGIALAFNIADIFYFEFILKRSTADMFMFANEGNIGNLIKVFIVDYYKGIILWFLLMVIVFIGYLKNKVDNIKYTKYVYIIGSIVLLLNIFFMIIGVRGGFSSKKSPITLSDAGSYTRKPIENSLVLNTPFCIIKTFETTPLEQKHFFENSELEKIYSPIHKVKYNSADFKNYNVVVLILESFGKEYFGSYNKDIGNGNYKGYTPFLDSLISKSYSFKNSFSNGRQSVESLPSILSSIPSLGISYIYSNYSSNQINGIANILKSKGYQTTFFHGAHNGSMGFDSFTKMTGYDYYFGKNEFGNDEFFDGTWGIWDEEFLLFMIDEIDKLKEPFLSTFYSLTSHHPFKIPEKYKNTFEKGTLEIHIPIQYTDMALKKFFNIVSTKSWFKNTLFVITADHANISYQKEYQNSMGDIAIPIIFFKENDTNLIGLDTTNVAQQIDIMPTVLNYLSYDEDFFAFGNDLFDDTEKKFAINNINNAYQFISGDYTLIFANDKVTDLYNYKNDWLLKTNLVGKQTETEQKMTKFLKAFIQQYNNRMISNQIDIAK